jgi:hypothetical protein
MPSATWMPTVMCAGKNNINVRVDLNINRPRNRLFEVGKWLAQGSMKLLNVITLSKPTDTLRTTGFTNQKFYMVFTLLMCFVRNLYIIHY